ncbi:MAG: hypothetical protein ACI9SE_004714, partial [Neolewinella sp.]
VFMHGDSSEVGRRQTIVAGICSDGKGVLLRRR